MAQAFTHVFFDLDHTLFDFEASKRTSLASALGEAGIDDWESLLPVLSQVERPLWHALEEGELALSTLNDIRFKGLVDKAGLDIDHVPLAASYLDWLGQSGGLLDGAREVLDALAGTHTLAMLSNGYSSVQRARLINFDLSQYFTTIVISDEIGFAKPDGRFFTHALDEAGGPPIDSVLMVGDNLRSDIAGATAAGLATCWYNPDGIDAPTDQPIDHTIEHLNQLHSIVI